MGEKYAVGSGLELNRDVPDLMQWVEERVEKRSMERMDLVFLPLVVAEVVILLARESWCYNEPVDEGIMAIRVSAKELALKMWNEFGEDGDEVVEGRQN